jgi:hypothetical protein
MDKSSMGFLLGVVFVLGFFFGVSLEQGSTNKRFKTAEQQTLISECEKALPRNQKCVIVLSTRIENIEEK